MEHRNKLERRKNHILGVRWCNTNFPVYCYWDCDKNSRPTPNFHTWEVGNFVKEQVERESNETESQNNKLTERQNDSRTDTDNQQGTGRDSGRQPVKVRHRLKDKSTYRDKKDYLYTFIRELASKVDPRLCVTLIYFKKMSKCWMFTVA